jgi:RHS repeat-associated protein
LRPLRLAREVEDQGSGNLPLNHPAAEVRSRASSGIPDDLANVVHTQTALANCGTEQRVAFGARYYSSTFGRFLTPDWSATPVAIPYAVMGNPQTLNLYAYVENNPITDTDPDGHGDNGLLSSGQSTICDGNTNCSDAKSHRDDSEREASRFELEALLAGGYSSVQVGGSESVGSSSSNGRSTPDSTADRSNNANSGAVTLNQTGDWVQDMTNLVDYNMALKYLSGSSVMRKVMDQFEGEISKIEFIDDQRDRYDWSIRTL